MMGACLAGSQIGAMVLIVFPALIIQILLTVTLILLTVQTVIQAISITKKENLKINQKFKSIGNLSQDQKAPESTSALENGDISPPD